MNITNITWEEILKSIILTHGQIGVIIVVGILSFFFGCCLSWVYLSKVKYAILKNNLSQVKSANQQLSNNLADANDRIDQLEAENTNLKTEYADIQANIHVREATRSDPQDNSLKVFTRDT